MQGLGFRVEDFRALGSRVELVLTFWFWGLWCWKSDFLA